MESAEIFAGAPVGIESVIETNRADRQFVTQPKADRVTHVVKTGLFGIGNQGASIGEHSPFEFAEERERVFNIEHGIELAANRVAMQIVRPEIALSKTTNGGASAVEETFVDGNVIPLIAFAAVQGVNKAGARAQTEAGPFEPALQCRPPFILHHTWRQVLGTERQIITRAKSSPNKIDFAAKR